MTTLEEVLRAVYRQDLGTLSGLSADEADVRDEDGRTPLMHAVLAADADPAVVQALIERGADVDAADDQGWTALHFAAQDQSEPLVRLLLEAGAPVDPRDSFGDTPLWRAVMTTRSEDTAAIRVLVEHGADPEARNDHGKSPLDVAVDSGQTAVVALLTGT